MYRASFNGIYAETTGTYKLYGLTPAEAQQLAQKHNGKISGSAGTYTVYDEAETFMWIQLYVHETNRMIRINIRPRLLYLTGKQRFTKKFISLFRKEIPKVIMLDVADGKYVLANPEEVIDQTI